ncbi:MAG: hypothetical protein ABI885_13170 [Gammaproteobacteria bacterium]
MLIAKGFFNSSGKPCLQITLAGVVDSGAESVPLEAVVDTGFTGHLSIPLRRAFACGLPLSDLVAVTLADGESYERLAARGRVTVTDRTEWVSVLLEPNSNEILAGMQLFRELGVALLITRDKVLLFDEEWVKELSEASEGGLEMGEPHAPPGRAEQHAP